MTNESEFDQLLEAAEDDMSLDDATLARAVAMQCVECNGNLAAAVEDLAGKSIETKRELKKTRRERDELIAALEEIQRRLHEQPVLMQCRSMPFEILNER